MSQKTQLDFEKLVSKYRQVFGSCLKLSAPSFEVDGFITTARLAGSGGHVELRCGPAEYHVEVFVYTANDGKRWSLLDLMSLADVRNWLLKNRPDTKGRSTLEAEIEYAFRLLGGGLQGDCKFNWIN